MSWLRRLLARARGDILLDVVWSCPHYADGHPVTHLVEGGRTYIVGCPDCGAYARVGRTWS